MSSILDALKKLELEREKKSGHTPTQSFSPASSRDLLSGPDRHGPRTITLTPAKLAIGAITIGVCMVVLSVAVSLIIARGGESGAASAQTGQAQAHVASAHTAPTGSAVRGATPATPRKSIQAGFSAPSSRQTVASHVRDTAQPAAATTPSPGQPAAPPVTPEPATPSPVAAAPAVAPEPLHAETRESKELVVTEQAVAAPEPPAESTPRPVQKAEVPIKTVQAPAPAPKEPPKKAPDPPKPAEPARVEVAKATPKPPAPAAPSPVSKVNDAPRPDSETTAEESSKPKSTPLEKDDTQDRPLDGEEAKNLSQEVNLSALPTLSESERLRLDLPKLKINIVGLPTKRQPHPSALINLNKVYVGENIPNTDARLIAVELRGVGIEVNGRKYFLPK